MQSEPRCSAAPNATSQESEDPESSTYGRSVIEIHDHGSQILRYHDDYLQTRSSEEVSPYEFVLKDDYLCVGRDFTVSAGHLCEDYNASLWFPRKTRREYTYGDRKFVKP